jgi:uncharacterized protein (TIGR02145 family)
MICLMLTAFACDTDVPKPGDKPEDDPEETVTLPPDLIPPPHAASAKVWIVGNQIWSDAIQIPECNKEDFGFYNKEDSPPDCRSCNDENGNTYYYYNWPYVDLNAAELCPSPWRVPTQEDFVALDKALGGNGEPRTDEYPSLIRDQYIQRWGGKYSGFAVGAIGVFDMETAHYWSSVLINHTYSFAMSIEQSGSVLPRKPASRNGGYQVRCVR